MEYVTMRQLAEELQISKVSVGNRLDKLNLRNQLIKSGNRLLIPESTADIVRESFKVDRKTEPPKPDTQSAVIELLSKQLEEKDKQIQSLMAQLEMLQSQNTDLLRSVREHSFLLLQANGIKTDTEAGANEAGSVVDPAEPEPQEQPKKKGFFGRIFR